MTTQRYYAVKYREVGSLETHMLYTINSLSGARFAQEQLHSDPEVAEAWIEEVDYQCRPLKQERTDAAAYVHL